MLQFAHASIHCITGVQEICDGVHNRCARIFIWPHARSRDIGVKDGVTYGAGISLSRFRVRLVVVVEVGRSCPA